MSNTAFISTYEFTADSSFYLGAYKSFSSLLIESKVLFISFSPDQENQMKSAPLAGKTQRKCAGHSQSEQPTAPKIAAGPATLAKAFGLNI